MENAKQGKRSACSKSSYADLITMAIESSPDEKLFLSDIYVWMIENVEVIKNGVIQEKSWKNSVRHNLSRHKRFVKLPGEQKDKGACWSIDTHPEPEEKKGGRIKKHVATIETMERPYDKKVESNSPQIPSHSMPSSDMGTPLTAPKTMVPYQIVTPHHTPDTTSLKQEAPDTISKQGSSQSMCRQQAVPQYVSPQQVIHQCMCPGQVATQTMYLQPVASHNMYPQQVVPQNMYPQQVAPQNRYLQQAAYQRRCIKQEEPQNLYTQPVAMRTMQPKQAVLFHNTARNPNVQRLLQQNMYKQHTTPQSVHMQQMTLQAMYPQQAPPQTKFPQQGVPHSVYQQQPAQQSMYMRQTAPQSLYEHLAEYKQRSLSSNRDQQNMNLHQQVVHKSMNVKQIAPGIISPQLTELQSSYQLSPASSTSSSFDDRMINLRSPYQQNFSSDTEDESIDNSLRNNGAVAGSFHNQSNRKLLNGGGFQLVDPQPQAGAVLPQTIMPVGSISPKSGNFAVDDIDVEPIELPLECDMTRLINYELDVSGTLDFN